MTTLLNVVAGLFPVTAGQLLLNGQPISGPGADRAMVFQSPALLPWRTTLDNVSYGLRLQGVGRKEARQRARRFIDLVGLNGFEASYPRELSGGMQQRANLARALTIEPSLLLLDEPLSALDAQTREAMQAELECIWLRAQPTALFVTHQISEAMVVNAAAAGEDAVLIGGLYNTYLYSLIARPEIASAADLKGKAVAISQPGSGSDSAMRAALKYFNLRPDTDAAPEMILTRENLPATAQYNTNNIGFEPAPDHPAYVIYTSGSTGRPRGVVVPHRQVLNRLAWMWQAYPLQPDDVGAQKTALNFVDSLWELLGYLLQGRPTVIIPDDALRDPHALVAALAEARVTQLWLVPSLLRVLLDRFPNLASLLPALRCWVSSGEPLPLELLHRFQRVMPRATLYNLYGTSEVWDATWYDPNAEAPLQHTLSGSVPIGRPIANVQCYVLDRHRQPTPIGVIGELYIGGAGLAGGYLNQPELTEEKFIGWRIEDGGSRIEDRGSEIASEVSPVSVLTRNPQSSILDPRSSTRAYKTGDLARWLPDGNIELLGRADFQVKLRGHRIELGEIEATLNQHPAVRQCVVVARPLTDAAEKLQLIAYIVWQPGQPGQSPAPNDLKDELSAWLPRKLPSYMIPVAFVTLEALPLTPNGKLDRRALPAPIVHHYWRNETRATVAPRDPLELQLTRIWESVLKVRPLSVTDNFFELGGHSLLAVQLFDRIAQVMTWRSSPSRASDRSVWMWRR